MISFDTYTLEAFVQEENLFFTGARISKIQQPSRREFLITLRNNGENRQLYINIQPQLYHICFAKPETLKKRQIETPKQPPMFCMLLRKYIENSKIAKVNTVKGDRIFELLIETYNEIGEKIYLCLAIELMGKHSNVILYNTDTDIIIGCAHNVGSDKSRAREVYGGIPYVYPPSPISLNQNFKSLISEYKSENNSSINNFIDNYYSQFIYKDKFGKLKNKYLTTASNKLKKVTKSLDEMNKKILSDGDNDKYRLYGDLLMANLYQLKDFSQEAKVYDYENNKNIQIPLNNTKTIKENANKFYKLYNKGKTAKEKLSDLINLYTMQKKYYEQLLYSVESAENMDDLLEISPEIEEDKNKNKTEKSKSSEIRNIDKNNGTKIYIGKNNKQNDYIISKLAANEDLWFHTKDCPGSHILLKTQHVTDELILECAKLAKENSQGKNSSKIGVIYTQRKYLRKPPKANLGYVTYKNEKEIIID
jgi:predicted ribosome quality control (RQC) complex YloA/Tae2 family protein